MEKAEEAAAQLARERELQRRDLDVLEQRHRQVMQQLQEADPGQLQQVGQWVGSVPSTLEHMLWPFVSGSG